MIHLLFSAVLEVFFFKYPFTLRISNVPLSTEPRGRETERIVPVNPRSLLRGPHDFLYLMYFHTFYHIFQKKLTFSYSKDALFTNHE